MSDIFEDLFGGLGGGIDLDAMMRDIDKKIAELDADVTSGEVETGKGVRVEVKEVDGKITEVNVTGNYDEAYDAKGSAKALEDGQVATNKSNIEALQELVGDGCEEIPEADIYALFEA